MCISVFTNSKSAAMVLTLKRNNKPKQWQELWSDDKIVDHFYTTALKYRFIFFQFGFE